MDRLEMLYRAVIMEHSESPKHKAPLEDFTAEQTAFNPTCGDMVKVQVKMDGDRLEEVQFDGEGCAISMASASIMADLLNGRSLEEAQALMEDFTELVQGHEPKDTEALGEAAALEGVVQFPTRIRCAQLGWKAVEDAIAQAQAQANPDHEKGV